MLLLASTAVGEGGSHETVRIERNLVGYYPVTGRTFVVRAGGRTVPEGEASPLTLGASYWGDSLVLEYAFQPVDDQSVFHGAC